MIFYKGLPSDVGVGGGGGGGGPFTPPELVDGGLTVVEIGWLVLVVGSDGVFGSDGVVGSDDVDDSNTVSK